MTGLWNTFSFIFLFYAIACLTPIHADEEAEPPAKFKIMPMGDALTVGVGHPGGYRKKLFYKLREKGYDVEFLGSSTLNPTASLLDNRHEGHLAWGCDKMMEFSRELLDQVDDPDVILLSIGAVDVMGDDYMNAIYKWDQLILHLSYLRPHAHIIASNLIHSTDEEFNNRVDAHFNPKVQDIIQKHKENNRKVSYIDLQSIIQPNHLNAPYLTKSGYKLVANAFLKAIQKITTPHGDTHPPKLVRAEGSLDRTQVILTFSKPISDTSAHPTNFALNHGVQVISADMDEEKRSITLTTDSKLLHSKEYTASVVQPIYDRTSDERSLHEGSSIKFKPGFRFLVLADWHSAEKYVVQDIYPSRQFEIDQDLRVVHHLSQNYGGDFVLIPGDTNSGQWTKPAMKKLMSDATGKSLTYSETVLEAGRRCYGGMLKIFRLGGYAKVLLSHGDHEAGDNPWKVNSTKSIVQPEYRKALGDSFNSDYDGQPRYNGTIGHAPARPAGVFSDTVYAYVHKNILVVTVDPFYQKSPQEEISEAGTVAMRIVGDQLAWLDDVLSEARTLPEIKHIFVQAHAPVLHPVRKSRSSGQMMEMEENSDFWKVLRNHTVDIYFTGEVHLNTVTKDKESNVLQIASRGNYFNNFLSVDVSDDEIHVRCHNEVGNKYVRFNMNYEVSGRLIIKKSEDTEINGWGQLALMDQSAAMIAFDFEEKQPLNSRSILGIGLVPDAKHKPVLDSVKVNGKSCSEVLPNIGEFGMDYDAQSTNVNLVGGISGKAGSFGEDSRAGIWAMGPHFGGREISYSVWFKTEAKNMPILIAYEGYWIKHNVMNLRLRNGRPELGINPTTKVRAPDSLRLNDGMWHHIVVSHHKDNGYVGDINMYVDGEAVNTRVIGTDSNVNFPNGGVISLGGFGHGRSSNESKRNDRTGFQNGDAFVGLMDDVKIFARGLSATEALELYSSVVPINPSPTSPPSIESDSAETQ